MNCLIYGSGFGLYGYLPAIYKFSKKIYLNENYKDKFFSRKEILKFKSKIKWYNNLNFIKNDIDIVLIAKRPDDQFNILKKILKSKNKIIHFFLEKPISINPKNSLILLNLLYKKRKRYSFGFIFKYLNWYTLIKKKINKNKKNNFLIEWKIKKNNKNNKNKKCSWKYHEGKGGGILRYYGIHFIKLFSDLNFFNIKYSLIESNHWNILICDKKLNSIELVIEYSNINNFSYKINKNKKYKLINPFNSKIRYKYIDPRCSILKKYIYDNLFKYNKVKCSYPDDLKFIKLWKQIELKSDM
jgi:hypothetical protein